MGRCTFQVLDGLERGRILRDLPTPINIGREEDNQLRLNDERVSRFHAKVQEHEGQYIVTDLESTNGTRVNGNPIQMHVLQLGDQLQIGRCLLVYGSPEDIDQLSLQRGVPQDDRTQYSRPLPDVSEDYQELFPGGPPELPTRLTPIQTARLSDTLAYVHTTLLAVLNSVQAPADEPAEEVVLSGAAWHRLQSLTMDLAVYLKKVAEPDA